MDALAINGLGVVSALGNSVESFWTGLQRSPILPEDLDMPQIAIRKFYRSPVDYVDLSNSMVYKMSLVAVEEALKDAAIDPHCQRVALIVGTGAGEIDLFEQHEFTQNFESVCAFDLVSKISQALDLRGPVLTVSNACASSATAFFCAVEVLPDVDAVVVCGTESFSRTTIASFNRMFALDEESCRPFAANRSGTVLGDGAAAIVLQAGVRAKYVWLKGIGMSCDAYHPTAPHPAGEMIADAANSALADAGIKAESIGVIVPHGTGTQANDAIEYLMLANLFGLRLGQIPVYPLKAYIGHSGGGCGAFGVLALSLMLYHGVVPALPECSAAQEFSLLSFGAKRSPAGRFGLTSAYAFGGNNVSLVLEAA